MAQVPSFLWCAVDSDAKLAGPTRIYSESVVKPSGLAMPMLQPRQSKKIDMLYNGHTFAVDFEKRTDYAWIVTTYHDFGDKQDHVQLTYLLCPGVDVAKQHENGSWDYFLESFRNTNAAKVLMAQRAGLLKTERPVAYTMSDFAGVMADCEMLHQAIAAEYFAKICAHASLPDAEWVGQDNH